MSITIKNVQIGDKFKKGKLIAEVVDFYFVKSFNTGETIRVECIAKLVNGVAINLFEIPFTSVVRNKIV